VLATVLFIDIVGSTDRAAAVGDARWAELLDDHDQICARAVERVAFESRGPRSLKGIPGEWEPFAVRPADGDA